MGAFVCAYNYFGFRLAAAPFSLTATQVGLVFLIYLVGAASSTVMGELSGRFGRRRVLWTASAVALAGVAITLPDKLGFALAGLTLLTWGFFRRAFDFVELGRPARHAGARSGHGALSVLLLSRLQRRWLARRTVLCALGLETASPASSACWYRARW